jgi:lipid IVA palmitoyltransferase
MRYRAVFSSAFGRQPADGLQYYLSQNARAEDFTMQQLRIALLIVMAWLALPLHAEPGVYGEQRITRWWGELTTDISGTWNAPQNYDLYLPFLSWHARFMYDKEKTDHYNEMPWGGGFGISRYNEEGNWSALYAMMFKDSHNEWQPIAGYGWEKG